MPITKRLLALLALCVASQSISTAVQTVDPKLQPPQRTLRVVALDAKGKPLAGVEIYASIWTDEKGFKANRDYLTDANGVAQVELPKTLKTLGLWASKPSFATLLAPWEQSEFASGNPLPAEYTFRLEPAVAAGGWVVDEKGKPISGVKVQVDITRDVSPHKSDDRVRYGGSLAYGTDAAITDADGRWRITNVPDHPKVDMSLLIFHPDFVSDHEYGGIQNASGAATALLRQEKAILTMKTGIIVQGQVTDPAGKPAKDAVIVIGKGPYYSQMPSKFSADADGKFRLPASAPRETTLTVIAPGLAPQLRKVDVKPGMAPQDFRLDAGKPIRLRIVDSSGKPIPKASVSIREWQGSQSIATVYNSNPPKMPDKKIPLQADADGNWEWPSAPAGPVKLRVDSIGYTLSELEIAGGDPERTVTLKGQHIITGRVTDAVTGKAIPAFKVIPVHVFGKDRLAAGRYMAEPGKNGEFSWVPQRGDVSWKARIEALGYRTQDGPEFRAGDDSARTQDFKLTPSPPIVGVVLDTTGKPLAKAKVLLATPTEWADITSAYDAHMTFTDLNGRFEFPDPGEPCAAVVLMPSGFARADLPAGKHDLGKLQLQPWASVRGTFLDGGKPVSGARVFLYPVVLQKRGMTDVRTSMQIVTGPDGTFEFPRVPPGPVNIHVGLGPWEDPGYRSGPSVPLDLKPGQQAALKLGGGETVVKGKVTLTGKIPAGLDCTYSLNYLVRREPGITPPPEIADLGFDIRTNWQHSWRHTLEGHAYFYTLQYWFVKLAPDGAFQISGVPPGEYDLAIEVYAKPKGCLVDPLAQKVVRVTVTEKDAASGVLTLPEIKTPVLPVPEVGDVPLLNFLRPDGKAGALAEHRGGYTVVHFWASWCAACKHQLPALQQLQKRFAAHKLTTLGLSLDNDAAAWEAALKRIDMPWPQGRLTSNTSTGVSSIPAYWLLDPTGAIVAKVNDVDELEAILAKRLK